MALNWGALRPRRDVLCNIYIYIYIYAGTYLGFADQLKEGARFYEPYSGLLSKRTTLKQQSQTKPNTHLPASYSADAAVRQVANNK